jgi:hypothetical protein
MVSDSKSVANTDVQAGQALQLTPGNILIQNISVPQHVLTPKLVEHWKMFNPPNLVYPFWEKSKQAHLFCLHHPIITVIALHLDQ